MSDARGAVRRTVLKFGGTSVGSPAALLRVAGIVKTTEGERIVVVSATAGTTDALVAAARAAETGDAQAGLAALAGSGAGCFVLAALAAGTGALVITAVSRPPRIAAGAPLPDSLAQALIKAQDIFL